VTERTKQLEKIDERWASRFEPAGIEAFLRSHGFCDIEDINFQEISPGSAALFKGSRTERLVFMWSTLNTTQAAKRGAHGNITDCRPRSERNEQASCVVAHSDFMSKHIQIGTDKRVGTLGFLRVVNKCIIADTLIETRFVTRSRDLVRKSSTDEMRVYR
jgi:hypothetical protein